MTRPGGAWPLEYVVVFRNRQGYKRDGVVGFGYHVKKTETGKEVVASLQS